MVRSLRRPRSRSSVIFFPLRAVVGAAAGEAGAGVWALTTLRASGPRSNPGSGRLVGGRAGVLGVGLAPPSVGLASSRARSVGHHRRMEQAHCVWSSPRTRCYCARGSCASSRTAWAPSSPRSAMGRRSWRRSWSIAPMSRSWMCACHRHSATRVCARPSRRAGWCRVRRCSCSASTWRRSTPRSCWLTVPAGWATCSRIASRTCASSTMRCGAWRAEGRRSTRRWCRS